MIKTIFPSKKLIGRICIVNNFPDVGKRRDRFVVVVIEFGFIFENLNYICNFTHARENT